MTSQASPGRPQIVEIVGLAGSGKSTTCKALHESCKQILPAYRVARTEIPAAIVRFGRWFIGNAHANGLRDPTGDWKGLYFSIHMEAMVPDLKNRHRNDLGTLILDQGPIFNCVSAERLAELGEIHTWVPKRMRQLLMQNLDFLDGVVVLDADLPILLGRIDERDSPHRIKGAGEESASAFLEDYRARYDSVLAEIHNRSGLTPIRLDTGQCNPEEVAEAIRKKFSLALRSTASPEDPAKARLRNV